MWKVYSVKTLYRIKAIGKPRVLDKAYRGDLDMIEERIVTIKARTFDEAVRKGEKEAIAYAQQDSHINPYGQKVVQKYIGTIDAFEPFDELKPNLEVFSITFLVKNTVSDNKVTENILGKEYKNELELRKKFFNSEFSGFVT